MTLNEDITKLSILLANHRIEKLQAELGQPKNAKLPEVPVDTTKPDSELTEVQKLRRELEALEQQRSKS